MVTVPAAQRTYLDHAATTVLRPAAREAFLEAAATPGNPSSTHATGRRARAVLDDALESISEQLGVPRSWLIMTSGGTEADNLAIRGAATGARAVDPSRTAVAVAATDHPAVVATARSLAPSIETRLLPVDDQGLLRSDGLDEALADGAVGVVSAALANNETGAMQDLAALAAHARPHGTVVHTDAVQGIGHGGTDGAPFATPAADGAPPAPRPAWSWDDVDLMTLSGHKIGAPVGVGVLIARPEVTFGSVSTGGGQQRDVRSGTLDLALASAFAAALRETLTDREQETRRIRGLADRLRRGIHEIDPEARLTLGEDTPRAEHIVHVVFPGAHSESLLFLLDERGIDASAGSACSAGVTQASPVLAAMGIDDATARGALRLSLGWTSTDRDVDLLLRTLPDALEKARAVGDLLA